MRKILVIGAGRSSSSLINYLIINAKDQNWFVRVGDLDENMAQQRLKTLNLGKAFILMFLMIINVLMK